MNNNVSRLKIVVTPKRSIEKDEKIKVKIKASTKEPYKKEISCEITLRVKQITVNSYIIEDVANRNYLSLNLINAQASGMPVTLSFDPSVVRIDLSDEAYINRVEESEAVDSNGFVKRFTFTMDKESTKNVKFYNVNMSENYTYPSGNLSPVITVSSQ